MKGRKNRQMILPHEPNPYDQVYFEERCHYCLEADTQYLMKCGEDDCQIWFCNKLYADDTKGTCILNHLQRTNHNNVVLHPDYSHGRELECAKCGCKNSFILLYDPDYLNLYCRVPCCDDMNYNQHDMHSLVNQDGYIEVHGHNFRVEDIRENPIPIESRDYHRALEIYRISLRYANIADYCNIMIALLELEIEYENEKEKNKHYRNVMIFQTQVNQDVYFYHTEYHARINDRADLFVVFPNYKIRIIQRSIIEEKLFLSLGFTIINPTQVNIEVGASSNVISKQINAIHEFFGDFDSSNDSDRSNNSDDSDRSNNSDDSDRSNDSDSSNDSDLNEIILGNRPNLTFNFQTRANYILPGNSVLNQYQNLAITLALSNKISLIKGPPGTGKTLTTSALIYHIDSVYENMGLHSDKRNILICTHSNVACTLIRKNLIRAGVRVLQISTPSKYREFEGDMDMLHNQVSQQLNNNQRYLDLQQQILSLNNLINNNQFSANYLDVIKDIEMEIENMRKEIESRIIKQYHIICTTCITSYSFLLKNIRFNHLIIDEATQIIEPEVIVCLTHKPKHIVMIGDPRQLGPLVKSQAAKVLGLGNSLFERLIDLNYPSETLRTQYRMHPDILEFPNELFYENQILSDVSTTNMTLDFNYPAVLNGRKNIFYNVNSREDINFRSFINRFEANAICNILSYIFKNMKKTKYTIGIITFYNSQVGYILNKIKQRFYWMTELIKNERLSVMSVDSCQGKEFDIVIISSVRASERGIGFLASHRRLNVALTRAKRSLVVVGNIRSLRNSHLWAKLIYLYKMRDSLIEGNFYNPTLVNVEIEDPGQYDVFEERPYR